MAEDLKVPSGFRVISILIDIFVKNAFKIQQSMVSTSSDTKVYADISASYWAHDAIVLMKFIDLTTGFKTNAFRPTDQATRADFSAAVYNGLHSK